MTSSLVARVGEKKRRYPASVVNEDHLRYPELLARLGRPRRLREEDSGVARLIVGGSVPCRQVLKE